MYSYSSSSLSLYGAGRNAGAAIRPDRKRSPLFIETVCKGPKNSAPDVATAPCTNTSCKSPFVTPNHPLYIFGDITPTNRDEASEVEPVRPQRTKKCRKSTSDISTPALNKEIPSPFRVLCLSPTFDDREAPHIGSQFETPNNEEEEDSTQQHQVEHRVIRKTTAFGMENEREMSMNSMNSPLEQKLTVIEADLEGEDGLAIRLRRMKRRLFLENVGESNSLPQRSDPDEHETSGQTPKHSNRIAVPMMEGMEVVLDEALPDATMKSIDDKHNGFYLTFSASTSSASLQGDIEQEEERGLNTDEPKPLPISNPKQTKTDWSVVTEATASCSTIENDDMHWASISSIAK